jgi:hypothetical protein
MVCYLCTPIDLSFKLLSDHLDRLSPLRSAYHDSHGAAEPCDVGIYEETITDVLRWSDEPTQSENHAMVYWLYGDSRSTTTAIAQRVARYAEQKGRLVSSFFFSWAGDASLRNPAHLIPTIMYRAALFDMDLRRNIAHAISHDPDIQDRQATAQISVLVKGAFNNYEFPSGTRPLIVIDALDTCEHVDREGTANDIATLIKSLSAIPVCIELFITSRFTQITAPIVKQPGFPSYRTSVLPNSHIQKHWGYIVSPMPVLNADDKGVHLFNVEEFANGQETG